MSQEYERIRKEYASISNSVVVFDAFENMLDAVHQGYKTVKGKLDFVTDVQNYLWSVSESGGNPHIWDKLLSRAKAHNINVELRALRGAYIREQTKRRNCNEGTNENERKVRERM